MAKQRTRGRALRKDAEPSEQRAGKEAAPVSERRPIDSVGRGSGSGKRIDAPSPRHDSSLEGLSGMVLGTQRRDNIETQPDVYMEFKDHEPTNRSEVRTQEDFRSADDTSADLEEEQEREPLDRGQPTEDKGLDR